ncbi:MAG: site-specific integrase [Candidatus Rickettsiella isopodorum]|nr:site-specific integrase [Candidatus Rickettsiella isopodorum]
MAFLLHLRNIYYRAEKYKVKKDGEFIRKKGKLVYYIKKKSLGKNKHTALKLLVEYNENRLSHKYGITNPDKSWQDFVEEYLTYSKTNKSARTTLKDTQTIGIFNRFKSINRISEFNRQILEEYKAHRKELGKKSSTINRELGTLLSMGKRLVEFGYLNENPLIGVKCIPFSKNGKLRFLDASEVKRLLTCQCPAWLKTAIYLGYYCGLRRGEVAHLEWSDISFERKRLTINPKENWHPKTYEIRSLTICDKLYKYLDKIKNKSGNVIMHSEDVLTTMTRKLFKKLGISSASFHTLRHTFASKLAIEGIDIYRISKMLGHSRVETTTIYSHLQPQHYDEAVEKL